MIKGISLNLVLKKKWFEMIEAGEKTEEYREIKLYWMKRIFKRRFSFVTFSYGYTKRRITFFFGWHRSCNRSNRMGRRTWSKLLRYQAWRKGPRFRCK